MDTTLDAKTVIGQTIVSAQSSLKNFSVRLESGSGLCIDAADGPSIAARVVPADQLPDEKEAVCSVDWSWIYKSRIKNFHQQNNAIKLELDPVGPLVIGASNWQGSSFLSFQPYKAPAR